jgi:fatty acid desaturase
MSVSARLASLRYMLTNLLLVSFVAALLTGGWVIWVPIILAMLVGGPIDELVGDDASPAQRGWARFCDFNLYATLPLLAMITGLLFWHAAHSSGWAALLGATIGAGYFYALAGVTVAHELIHRTTSNFACLWGRALFALTINPTFETYHVHGHHRNVGTSDDAATARRGEYALAFVMRTVIGQSIAGRRIEAERLRGKKTAVPWLHNRVGSGLFFSFVIAGVAATSAGVAGILVFLAAAAFGRLLHELLNYVQHYGLVRVKGTSIEARHSWDCYRSLSNALHYNLPRHADHHMFAAKPFWELAAAARSPTLPRGYETMALIALFPPLWRSLVDPLLAEWDLVLATNAERSLVQAQGGRRAQQALS